MDAGHIRVSSVTRGLTCVIEVSGELTQATEHKFAAQVAEAQVALRGPVLFDVSGVNFVDCRGARAMARAVRAVPPPHEARLRGCSPTMRRVLRAIGFDLPHRSELAGEASSRPQAHARAVAPSREEAMVAMSRATKSEARRSALYASELMSRLAATYSAMALNSRYRTQHKSEDRGRLLELSGRALELSRRYLRNADSVAR